MSIASLANRPESSLALQFIKLRGFQIIRTRTLEDNQDRFVHIGLHGPWMIIRKEFDCTQCVINIMFWMCF